MPSSSHRLVLLSLPFAAAAAAASHGHPEPGQLDLVDLLGGSIGGLQAVPMVAALAGPNADAQQLQLPRFLLRLAVPETLPAKECTKDN